MVTKKDFDEDYYSEENSEHNFITSLDRIMVRGEEVEFPSVLYNNLKQVQTLVEHHFDTIFFVDGTEGSGKSETAKQCSLIINNDFSEDDIVYTPDQFEKWVLSSKRKKGDVCLWDEFIFGGNTGDALTSMQNSLIKMFVTMRSKGLVVLLVAPSIFLIRKYFAIFRTRFLLHCYCKGINRGYMKFYTSAQKQMIYNYGYKTWFYSPSVKPAFTCRLTKWSDKFLDEAKIEKKKQEAIKSLGEPNEKKFVKMTPKQMEYFLRIPLSSVFPHESLERYTLDKLQQEIRQFMGLDLGNGEKDTNIINIEGGGSDAIPQE